MLIENIHQLPLGVAPALDLKQNGVQQIGLDFELINGENMMIFLYFVSFYLLILYIEKKIINHENKVIILVDLLNEQYN